MAFTKIVGAGIHTLSNITSHNIHSSGIITATKFDGPFDGSTGDFSGNVTITGNLTVNGTTTTLDTNLIDVDKIEVTTAGTNVAVAVTHNGTGDLVRLYDGSTQKVTIDDVGNVGLGSAIPSAKLDVQNNANIEVLRLKDTHHNKYLNVRGGGSPNRMVFDSYEGSGGGADIDLASNGDTKVRIKSTGDVGIGSLIPQAKLELDGRFRILDNSDGTPSTGKGLEISYYTSDDMADILSYDRGGSSYKKLQLRGSSIELKKNNSAKIIVGTGGNGTAVGFGTTSCLVTNAEAISVRGYSSFKSSNKAYAAIYVASEGSTDDVANQLLMFNAGGANRGGFGYVPNTGELRFNHQYFMTFCTGSQLMGGTERLRITSDGYVGINETSPIHQLSIGINTATAWSANKNISNTTNNDFIGLNLTNSNSAANAEVGILFQSTTSGAGQYSINCRKSAGSQAELIFRTRDGGSASKEVVKFDSGGRTKFMGTRAGSLQPEDTDSVNLYTKSTNNSINRGSGISFFIHDNSDFEMGGTIQVAKENATADDTASYMRFCTRPEGSTSNPTLERLRISSAGLIETRTRSAEVRRMILSGSPTNSAFNIEAHDGETGTSSGDVQGKLGLFYNDGSTLTNTANISFERGSGAADGAIAFVTNQTEKLRITSDGNVGIGTDLPNTASSVLTVAPINSNSGRNISIFTSGSVGNKAGLFFNSTQGTGNLAEIQAEYKGTNEGELVLSTSMQKRITIQKGGNVGIGSTIPPAKLTVDNGTNDAQFVQFRNDNVGLFFGAYGTGATYDREATINGSRTDAGSSPFLRIAGQGGIRFCADLNNEHMRVQSNGEIRLTSAEGNNSDTPGFTWRGGNATQSANFARIHSRMVSNWGGQLQFKVKQDDGNLADNYLTGMKIDENGHVTKPQTPAFFATHTGATSPATGTLTYNTSGTGYYNNGSHLDTSTGKFTAPIDGIYHFHFHGFIQSNDPSDFFETTLQRQRSGVADISLTRQYGHNGHTGNNYGPSYSMQCTTYLEKNDTVHVYQHTNGVGFHGSNGYYFGGYLVG